MNEIFGEKGEIRPPKKIHLASSARFEETDKNVKDNLFKTNFVQVNLK